MNEVDLMKLDAPFADEDLEWRVQTGGVTKAGKVWAIVVPYVTNRAIQERLDAVVGKVSWQNEFLPGPGGGLLCRLSIQVGEEWVSKEDGADNTAIEAVKGGLSASMKRAAVQWGIGRYLYGFPKVFADVLPEGKKGDNRDSVLDGNKKKVFFSWNNPRQADVLKGASPPESGQKKANGERATEGQIAEMETLAAQKGLTPEQRDFLLAQSRSETLTRQEAQVFIAKAKEKLANGGPPKIEEALVA